MQQISKEWIGQVKVIIYTEDCIIITLYMLKAGRNANGAVMQHGEIDKR